MLTPDLPNLERLCGNVVTLLSGVLVPDSEGVHRYHNEIGSGFAIEVDGNWWLATAGHVVQGLIDHHANGKLATLYACDAWAGPDGTGRPVILPRDPNDWFVVGDANELDLGLIRIGPLISANLQAGGIVAVKESDLRKVPTDFEFYILLGYPWEMVETTGTHGEPPPSFHLPRAIIHVNRIERPSYAVATAHDRFYGELRKAQPGDDGVVLSDIGGVSGGPIIGCKLKGHDFDTWTIAIQSGWFKETKVIVADYLITLVNWIRSRAPTRRSFPKRQ